MFEFEGKQTVFRLKWMLGIQEDLKAAPRLPSKTVATGELQNLRQGAGHIGILSKLSES